MKSEYDQLNPSLISSGFWYPQAIKQRIIPDGNSFDQVVDAKECASIYAGFFQACIDSSLDFFSYDNFRNEMREQAISEKVIPISILDITYHDFKPECFQENLLMINNGKVAHAENAIGYPFEEKECLVLWVDMSHVRSGVNDFVLRESLFLTNRSELPFSVEIDFDDGQGFRTMLFDDPVSIDYNDAGTDKIIKLKLQRTNQELRFGAMKTIRNFTFLPCETTEFPFPNLPSWPTTDNYWKIQSEYMGDVVEGNAYTLFSDDQVFDKPFIFVEGVDFGVNDDGYPISGTYQNGNFGWCEFSSGFFDPDLTDEYDYPYDNLKLMPEMLHELRAYGYDLILLDFQDGADELRKNSQLLKHLINLCNEYKSGNESLIVSGASMGGQITRYALRSMELEGIDHCAKLWISMDSPHKGANIPIAMQNAIEFLCDLGKEPAIIFREKYLKRPAARQMLNDQVFSSLAMRDAWYNELDDIGFPEQCKRVAVANGSLNGTLQEINLDPLLNWECGTFDQLEIITKLHHMGGNPYVINYLGQKQLVHFKLPTVGLSNISAWNILFGLDILDFYNVEERMYWKTDEKPNWDYAAGGYRNSVSELVKSLNYQLSDFFIDVPCGLIGQNNYNSFHSFVSTLSALALESSSPNISADYSISSNSNEFPFHNYYAPYNWNEEHVEITQDNLNFILSEALAFELSGLGSILTSGQPNNGLFNYGKKSFTEIRSIDISQGGKLHFNSLMPTHFASDLDELANQSVMQFSTSTCTPATIRIGDEGLINIGDQFNDAINAEVHIHRDSKLIVDNGGLLRINSGSKLVIHEGAELYLEPGSQLEINNGRIEILAGGVMNAFGVGMTPTIHAIKLNGSDACISFENGKLQLSDHVTLTLDTSVDETGYFEILPGSENTLHTEVGSKLVFEGKNQDDVVLRINNYAHLQNANFSTGSLVFKSCKVDLNNHGAIYTDMPTIIDNVRFVANELDIMHGGNVVVWYSTCVVKNAQFDQVRLTTKFSKLSVKETEFNGAKSGIDADNGAYEVKECDFNLAAIRSEGLQNASLIENCHFEGGICSQVLDKSLVELFVKGNYFANAIQFGLEKQGGKLSASCNVFNDVYGIRIMDGDLNMSSNNGAGYNVFNQTPQCIELENAATVDLRDGFNDFSGVENYYLRGTINLLCGEDNCFPEVDARGNLWGFTSVDGSVGIPDWPVQPDPQLFDVTTTIVVPCAGYENTNACSVTFSDSSPVVPEQCPEKVKLVVKTKMASGKKSGGVQNSQAKDNEQDESNPLINTVSFQNIALDSALVFAASLSEAYDSSGNDLVTINLLNEILTSGLDFYNLDIRSKMNWARYVMKSAVERMFLHGELIEENNVNVFETPVGQYVDVLNLMTDTALTDSTYLDQFYLELDKGQLFRTMGNRETALTIFEHLGDCQLDSLEQIILQEWRLKTQSELEMTDQYIVQNVPADSIAVMSDSVDHGVQVNLDVSDFYFGLWIDSPQSVTFVTCGNDPVYRDAWSSKKLFDVFPNPSGNFINIIAPDKDIPSEVQLWDTQGRRLMTDIVTGEFSQLRWPAHIAAGTYVLRISNDEIVEDHLIMISQE